jgi:hypothetical protein
MLLVTSPINFFISTSYTSIYSVYYKGAVFELIRNFFSSFSIAILSARGFKPITRDRKYLDIAI